MGQVAFNYSLWAQRYPEFAGNPKEPLANLYFNEAQLYLDNTPYSRVQDLGQRELLLFMITAHIARLNQPGADGQPANALVGRISDASEGSVSVSAELMDLGKAAAFWTQTPYGFAFWQATAPYRTGVYRAAPPYVFPPYGYAIAGRGFVRN